MKRALLKMVELFIFLQCIDVQIKKAVIIFILPPLF